MTRQSPQPGVGRSLAANLTGSGWYALLTLAVVPVYVHLLGAELYGLVGFYATLQMLSLVIDRGFGTAANREIARMSASSAPAAAMRALLRTMELVYFAAATVIAVALAAAAHAIAVYWLHPVQTAETTIARGVVAMGIALAVQFPFGLYSSVLMGLQRHGRYNAILIGGTTLRLLLPVIVLVRVGPDVVLFFATQAAASALQVLAARIAVDRALPRSEDKVRAVSSELKRLRGFAAGAAALTLLNVVVLQLDKLMLSHLSTLAQFGYYSVAAAAATGIGVVSLPVYTVVFPRFSQLLASGATDDVEVLYHRATQVMAALVMPLCALIVLFARPLLLLWTRDGVVADEASVPLALLTAALCASALTYVPQALQLADGWTSFGITINAIGIAVLIPAMLITAPRWGGAGVASTALGWQVAALAVTVIVMHRSMIRGSILKWVFVDVGAPLAASVIVVASARALFAHLTGVALLALVAITGIAALAASFTVSPATWFWVNGRRGAAQKV